MSEQEKPIPHYDSNHSDSDDDDDSDCDLEFATLDLTGVDFDAKEENDPNVDVVAMTAADMLALQVDKWTLMTEDEEGNSPMPCLEILRQQQSSDSSPQQRLLDLADLVAKGNYVEALQSPAAQSFFVQDHGDDDKIDASLWSRIQQRLANVDSLTGVVEVELMAIAAFNLFLQLNYTGP
ncbi:MAG: hypothetical protein SGILL_002405, partial [Bacillariaceae sp.]